MFIDSKSKKTPLAPLGARCFLPPINGLNGQDDSRSYKYFAPTALMTRLFFIFGFLFSGCLSVQAQQMTFNVVAIDRQRVIKSANQYLSEPPITITASHSPRSAGGTHDF